MWHLIVRHLSISIMNSLLVMLVLSRLRSSLGSWNVARGCGSMVLFGPQQSCWFVTDYKDLALALLAWVTSCYIQDSYLANWFPPLILACSIFPFALLYTHQKFDILIPQMFSLIWANIDLHRALFVSAHELQSRAKLLILEDDRVVFTCLHCSF